MFGFALHGLKIKGRDQSILIASFFFRVGLPTHEFHENR